MISGTSIDKDPVENVGRDGRARPSEVLVTHEKLGGELSPLLAFSKLLHFGHSPLA